MASIPLKFTASDVSGLISAAIVGLSVPVAKAATLTIKEAGGILQVKGRVHIHNAGFSRKWENAYKVTVYPTRGNSIDAAAFGVFRRIPFSDIFSTGGRIAGNPMLWLPLPTTPKLDRRKAAANIRDYNRKGIVLFSMKSKSGKPLLGANVLLSKSRARQRIVRISAKDLQPGERFALKSTKRSRTRAVLRAIPLFFGIPSVRIRKRFNWKSVQDAVQGLVPGLYDKHISRLADE